LHLALDQFTCDKEKIFWTLAFFKDRRAAKWSKNLFHQEADTSIFPIQSWVDVRATRAEHSRRFLSLNYVIEYVTTHLQEIPQRIR